MTEIICSQGHVIDPGRLTCGRCNSFPIGQAEVAPVINEEAEANVEETAVLDVDSLTAKELKAELTLRGIEFSALDLKASLQKKLKKALKAEAEEKLDEEAEAEADADEEVSEDSSEDEL